MRHTTAMHLIRGGSDISTVSYWLGHAHLNTTHIYVEIDMQMKRKMLEKIQPPKTTPHKTWHQTDIIAMLDNLSANTKLCEAG